MARLHLGNNTCYAEKRWPEPERWLSIVKQELGLQCCQFSLDLVDPMLDENAIGAYADAVRKCAAANNIVVHSTFTGLAAYSWSMLLHPDEAMRAAAMRWYERAIDFTTRMGARGTGGHLGALSVQDALDEARKDLLIQEMMERLQSLSRYAAQKGLQFLLFENMAVTREWGHSIEEARTLTDLVTRGGVPLILCIDVGHPCALHTGTPDDDYLTWLTSPWSHTPVVHLQQTDATGDHHWPFTGEYNRRGSVRAESVLNAIQSWPGNSDVYLFLEPIHPFEADDALVLRDLRESVQYWQSAMRV
ncbi:MAG: sugar phosphate isomerase/epimerase [Chloroflexota bacterium]|nr:sugar phosphate isomerase/epimerase [Chloroflexota bacterium]